MADPFSTQAAAEIQIAQSAQNAVVAVNNLSQVTQAVVDAIVATFPGAATSITHTATAGADTLPAAPAGFLTVTIGGTPYKIALYGV